MKLYKATAILSALFGVASLSALGAPSVAIVPITSGDPYRYNLDAKFTPSTAEAGQLTNFYIAAVLNNQIYFFGKSGWSLYMNGVEPPFASNQLFVSAGVNISILKNLDTSLLPVDATVYAGYGSSLVDLVATSRYQSIAVVRKAAPITTPTPTPTPTANPALVERKKSSSISTLIASGTGVNKDILFSLGTTNPVGSSYRVYYKAMGCNTPDNGQTIGPVGDSLFIFNCNWSQKGVYSIYLDSKPVDINNLSTEAAIFSLTIN